MPARIYLIRHGETAWSLSGKHTGSSEIPLNEKGEHQAIAAGRRLHASKFQLILTSPRERARRTCELAGFRASEIDPDLAEWDYGDYEGLTTVEIRKNRPDWDLFRHGCPAGESPLEISNRADRVIQRLKDQDGDIALFSHGHFLRVLAARWSGQPASGARHLFLDTGSISILGFERNRRETPGILSWNCLCDHEGLESVGKELPVHSGSS